jgi:two-component system CheB/CheR fusion protein
LDAVQQVLRGAPPQEKRIRTWAGDDYLRRVQPYHDPKGVIAGAVITFYELTSGEQQTEFVSIAEPPLQTLIDALPVLISYVDRDERYQFTNAAYEKCFGIGRNSIKGKRISAVVGQACYRRIAAYVQQALRGQRVSYDTEIRCRNVQIRYVHVEYIPHLASEGHVLGFFALVANTVDQRQNEVARNWLAAIVSSSQEAIIGKTLNGIVTSWNRGAERIYGYTAGEMVGNPISRLIPEERGGEYELLIAKLRRGEQVDEFETIREKKGGQRIRVSLTLSPIRDDSERIMGVSVISHDITKRKQIEEKMLRDEATLHSQANLLADMDRRKDAFLAMLAHELRNPLAPIQHAVELLQAREHDLDAEQQWAADMIARQVERIAYLVSGFLDVSRLIGGQVVLHKRRADIVNIVSAAVDNMRSIIESRHQQLRLSLPEKPVWIQADPARLEQVVQNLLHNATEYTEQRGKLSVTVCNEKTNVLIKVQDTGAGISQEALPHILELFGRSGHSWYFAGNVLGFGLPVVKNLVEMHGGKVLVTSKAGEGSEFVVRLPLDLNLQLPGDTAGKERAGVVEIFPHRILLVEDNKDVADSFAALLRAKRHTVEVVHDGPSALQVAEHFRPEIVFIDIGLPTMSGYEVARSLRKEYDKTSMSLVAITGYGQYQDVKSAQEAGFDHHMLKPVKLQDIESVIISCFGDRKIG